MRFYAGWVIWAAIALCGCASTPPPAPSPSATSSISQGEVFLNSAKEAAAKGKHLEAGTSAELAVAYFQAHGPKPSLIKARELAALSYAKARQKDMAVKQYQELVRLVPGEGRYKKALAELQQADVQAAARDRATQANEAANHNQRERHKASEAAQAAPADSGGDGQVLHDAAHMASRVH